MDDLISRQAVLSLPKDIVRNMSGEIFEEFVNLEDVKALPSAQPEQQWIPCSERLPENDVFVLVTLQHFNGEIDVVIAKVVEGYFSKGLEWESDDGEWTWDIKHGFAWMPLPKPYTEDADA